MTYAKGGMIGATRAALSAAIEKPEKWLIRCAIFASVISVIYYAGDKAKDGTTQAILVLLGLSAVGFHYVGAQKACRAWYERQLGAFILWCLIVLGSVSWEVNNTLAVASNNQSNLTNAQRAAFTKSDNTAKGVADAEERVARLRSERNMMKPSQSPAAARAVVASAKAHRFWGVTNSCTETKGPQTRKHCDAYRAAEADIALWDQIAKQEIALGAAEQELAEARKAAMQTPVLASADRGDFKNLKRLTGLGDDDLELSQSLLTVIVLALFLTIAGWLVKAEEYEGLPRKPWFGKLFALLTGKPMPATPARRAMTKVQEDIEEVMEVAKDTGRGLVAAASEKGREIIRETKEIVRDDGLRQSIQRRLDEINARPRRRLA